MASKRWLRSAWGGVVRVMVVVAGVSGCSGDGRLDRTAPSPEVLEGLCSDAFEDAFTVLDADREVTVSINNEDLGTEDQTIRCDGDDEYRFAVDGKNASVSMAVAFHARPNPAAPEDEYCDSEGVSIASSATEFDSRQFSGNPYCLSWDNQKYPTVTASYLDRSTAISLYWSVSNSGDALDEGSQMRKHLEDTAETIFSGIYQGFSEAE